MKSFAKRTTETHRASSSLFLSPSKILSLGLLLLPTLLLSSAHFATCFVLPAIIPGSLAQSAPATNPSSSSSSPSSSTCRSSSQLDDTDSSSSSSSSNTAVPSPSMKWSQHELSITAPSRGCHLITNDVRKAVQKDIAQIKIGMCNLFVQHTSASLTLNENADPDVRRDLEVALNKIVPASWNHDGTFRHTMEGDDDMPGHVKTSLMGPSLNIPIRNGKLALGTWQGIYLNEHRDQGGWGGGHTRNIIVTLQGQG